MNLTGKLLSHILKGHAVYSELTDQVEIELTPQELVLQIPEKDKFKVATLLMVPKLKPLIHED